MGFQRCSPEYRCHQSARTNADGSLSQRSDDETHDAHRSVINQGYEAFVLLYIFSDVGVLKEPWKIPQAERLFYSAVTDHFDVLLMCRSCHTNSVHIMKYAIFIRQMCL